jgi:hypothetical protein
MDEKTRLTEIAKLATPGGRQSWGGIGGSGKHAAELMAELEAIAKQPEVKELISGGRVAWGGIGGSGKHAADLEPEAR